MLRFYVSSICILGLLLPAMGSTDEPKDKKDEVPVLRELSAKGVKFREDGRVAKPNVVTSAKELAEVVPDKEEQARIAREVNFEKQHLLVFSWGGSGGDKLTSDVHKGKDGPEVVFTYTGGLTLDLQMHMRLYAVRNGVTWKFAKGK